MLSPPAYVTPLALKWARESIGYTLEAAAEKIGVKPAKLAQAEHGEVHLTMRQAEKAAGVYQRPLAALFLPEPPQEEPQEAQFRRLPGAPRPPWPPEMRALARRIRTRQDEAAELYEALEEEPPWVSVEIEYVDDTERFATRARNVLGVGLDEQHSWHDQTGYAALRAWTDSVEALGALVTQDGTLALDVMRGFASTHPTVPAIVVNTKDDARARAFTIVHELGHLLRAKAGRPVGPTLEAWCNDFAAGVLMPEGAFIGDFERARRPDLLQTVDALALSYGVTPLASAVRVARLQLAPEADVDSVLDRIRLRSAAAPRSEGGGGNYYLTKVARLGPSFVQLVFSALDNQALSYPAAAGLLGVKVNHFDKLRERVVERAGGG